MPPLPPNITKAGILRTTPSWEQRHFARKDNVTRFITHRFPNKPRDDPGLANPPLPPSASRLAFHKGSTRPGSNSRSDFQWVAVAELPRITNDTTFPIALAISSNSETVVAGYPTSIPNTGIVRAYSFSSESGLSQKGQELDYPEGVGAQGNQEAGYSAAITSDGTNLLVGIPSRQIGANPTNGLVFSYKFDIAFPQWNQEGEGMYYSQAEFTGPPAFTGLHYGQSVAITDFNSSTSRWYSVAGIPGAGDPAGDPPAAGAAARGCIYVVSHKDDGEFSANIGTDNNFDPLNAIFYGQATNDKFGSSTDISNLTNNKLFVAAASHSDTLSYVRMLVGTLTGTDLFTWEAAPTNSVGNSIFDSDPSQLCVRTTADGSIVAIGNPSQDSVVVKYSTDEWQTHGSFLGQTLQGITLSGFGTSVAIDRSASSTSLEGTIIVIGQPFYSTPLKPNCGRVIVMEIINNAWQQVLNPVVGQSENEQLGLTVAMRDDGSFLASGSQSSLGRAALFQVRNICEQ